VLRSWDVWPHTTMAGSRWGGGVTFLQKNDKSSSVLFRRLRCSRVDSLRLVALGAVSEMLWDDLVRVLHFQARTGG
jgi:hypothetical protein